MFKVKILFVLVVIVPFCVASAILGPVVVNEAKVNTGVSSQYRAQDSLGNYEFAYNEDHATGGTFRKESGSSLGPVVGSYGLRDLDGRVRVVNYVADDAGFRAAIATNEPGIVPKSPASVAIVKPGVSVAAVSGPVAHAESLVPAHSEPLGINSPLIASIAPKIIAAPPLAYTGPTHIAIASPAIATPLTAPISHAPIAALPHSPLAALIRSYATSIYGPALISSNHQPLLPQAFVKTAYQPPLATPSVHYHPASAKSSAPVVSHISTEKGYYEPSLTYAHPAAWGYTFGLPSTWGYQLVYRRKK